MTSAAQRQLAARVRGDRQVWRDLVAEVGRERMLEPGPMGEWTFKDMAAHLAAWRNVRIPMLEAIGRGGAIPPPPWPAEMDDDDPINAWFRERDRDRPLDDVLADYDGSFERLAAAIEALPENVAHDPNALPWAGGTPAVDIDFTDHLHDEHLPDVRAWLAARAPASRAWGTEANPLIHPVTGERIVFRRRARDTGGEFLEMNLMLGPSGFVAAEHVHPNQEERFEISGAPAMFRVDGVERLYQPGEVAIVPPGTPHVWWNPGDGEVTTLIQFRPALDTETFFETFFGLARDGKVGRKGLPSPLQLMVLARAYNREMQLPRARQRVLYPIAVTVAPIARALGYRGRYDKYSGPRSGT